MKERKAPKVRPTPDPESEAWKKLPWRKFEQHVYHIQKRIYRASQRGESRKVQKLQKLLMKSEAARLLAVRRVTQDNQGKKTAGVDGVKSVKPKQRPGMAKAIHPACWNRQRVKPVRRVWIPKPGKAEQRPLGIPTMMERCKQALVKMALEPEWEAKFEANSYGFRPGRCCQDAIAAIFLIIQKKPKYVLDADIKGAFDYINQKALLEKLHTYPAMRQIIRSWLKAGVMDGKTFSPTEQGTPQGGVISPLLMNIALHGMEEVITAGYSKSHQVEKPKLVRYADDFAIFHSQLVEIEKATETMTQWLAQMGLTLSPKKTRLTHTLVPYQGEVGLNFLGVSIQQIPVGKTHTGKSAHGHPLGYKTICQPSKEAVKRHIREVGELIRKRRSVSQEQLIRELNPIIRGWSAYYRTVVSSRVFAYCDSILWFQLMRWVKTRHHHESIRRAVKKYWHQTETRQWVFVTSEGKELRLHQKMAIQQYVKVKGQVSPYDGNWFYWSQRLKSHPMMTKTKARLLQKQHGICRWCELLFKAEDLLEVDHLDHNHAHNELSNLVLLHRHCHDERHAKFLDTTKVQKLADAGINIK
jgi:RNA-directed DNA polymerase